MSTKGTVTPDKVDVYGEWAAFTFNEETGEWEEDFVEDPILALIEAEMKRQVDDTKALIAQAGSANNTENHNDF